MTRLVERHGGDEPRMLDEGEALLRALVGRDDWLPGQKTPIHGYHDAT